jgi:Protein of unknown function (DUF2914)
MLRKTLMVLLSALILSGVCFAQADPAKKQMEDTASPSAQKQPALVLEEIQFYRAVKDRQPSGVGSVFPEDLDKLYCFSKIGGAEAATYVYHVWYFRNKEIARVKLPVKSKSWRTWSSKNLHMGLGYGHVDVVSESGDILGRAEFKIQAAEKAEEVGKTEKAGVSKEQKEAPKAQ